MKKNSSAPTHRVLNPFIEKHQKDVMGILHSFDRLRLQGSLGYLYCRDVFEEYLNKSKVLCKDFKKFATGLTTEVCQSAEQLARSLKRPFTYLASSALSKEEEAQRICRQDKSKRDWSPSSGVWSRAGPTMSEAITKPKSGSAIRDW